jgi:hypothetical protein
MPVDVLIVIRKQPVRIFGFGIEKEPIPLEALGLTRSDTM